MSTRTGLAGCTVALALLVPQVCGGPSTPAPSTPPSASRPEPSDEAVAWLRQEAFRFVWADPLDPLDDLEPLRGMIGDARVVALGEATHGTREFFRMKHRILRFLAERMGFTAFAIEATWPEANRLDRFVRTGEGDPAVLLSGLYFWTWNTDSVLGMIRWMRAYNEAGGSLGFYGFDMQFPGMAIDNVEKFVHLVDPASDAEFWQYCECLARYANDARGLFPSSGYQDQPADYRDACLEDLRWVERTLVERETAYVQASSAAEWARAVQSARVAIQYANMVDQRSRDAAMADNALWLLDQLGPDGKIVLWAHNGHVATIAGSMGQDLRDRLGDAMVVVGFAFARGSLTARTASGSTVGGPAEHTVDEPRTASLSYEDYFLATGLPWFILDLRNRDPLAPETGWLTGPLWMRHIGALYYTDAPNRHWRRAQLPSEFDLIVYFRDTTASFVLPFQHPSTF